MNYLIDEITLAVPAVIASEPELRQYGSNDYKTASVTLSDKYGNKLKEICIDVPDDYCTTQEVLRTWVFRTLGIMIPIETEGDIVVPYTVITL